MRNKPAKLPVRHNRPLIEMLEQRQLLSGSAIQLSPSTGVLTVTGTPKNDHISVKVKGSHLVAKMDGKTKKFAMASVQSLVVNAGAGNDVVTVAPAVTVATTLNGGPGNNVLVGGSGTTSFVPGGGTDAVFGFHTGDGGEDDSNGQPGKAGRGGLFFGSVASVDTTASTLTLNTFAQSTAVKAKTFKVATTTTLTIDGQPASLAALGSLTAGAHVILQVSPTDATTATSIAATGPHVEGSVVSVDTTADTITLQGPPGAANQTYTVSSTAAITVDNAASTLSALTAGENVELWLSATDGTTVVTVDVGGPANPGSGGPADPGGGGPGGAPNQGGAAIGSVSSVDTTAGTITLTVLSPSGTSQQTFSVTSATTITVDGTTAALSALSSLGSSARVIVQPAAGSTTTAASISAVGPHLDGTVASVDSTDGTITLDTQNGASAQTFTVGASAEITLDGAVSTLSKIVATDRVDLRLSAVNGSSVIALNASDQTNPTSDPTGGTGSTGGEPANPGAPGGVNPGAPEMSGPAIGSVSSVDTTAGTITLSILSDAGTTTQQTFGVTSGTTIKLDGRAVSLSALAGLSSSARVIVNATAGTGTTFTATSIEAVGPRVQGPVASVDAAAGTISLQAINGQAAQTYTVGAGATITIDGVSGTLAAITSSDGVQLQLSAADGTTVVSIDANTNPAGGGASGAPGGVTGAPGGGTGTTGGGAGTTGGGTGTTGGGTGTTGGGTGTTGGGTGTPGGGTGAPGGGTGAPGGGTGAPGGPRAPGGGTGAPGGGTGAPGDGTSIPAPTPTPTLG